VNFREDQLTTFEILMNQRKFNFQQSVQANAAQLYGPSTDAKLMLPPELERQYQVFIVHGAMAKKHIQRMRDVKAQSIGSLVNVKGIVTRCSDVKPCI
jgi:DNA replicative helicase MCM subunit Mcm2 (Cdc46/Mcm family)